MKKLSFLFIFVFLFIFTANAEQQFVNPIFNQPLEPLSNTTGWAYLQPTFVKFSTPFDKNIIEESGKCRLLENQRNFIKLFCHIKWPKDGKTAMKAFSENYSVDYYYTYTIKGLFFATCLDIEENIYEIHEKHTNRISSAHYCVTPPNKLEFD